MFGKRNISKVIKLPDIISIILIVVLLSNLTIVFAAKKTVKNKKVEFKDTEIAHNKYNVEWWYFNFNLDDGYSGYLTVLKGKFKGREKEDYIAFVQLTKKEKVILKTSLLYEKCNVSTDKLNIEFKGFNDKKEKYTILINSEHKTKESIYNVTVKKGSTNVIKLIMKQDDIDKTGLRLGNDGKIEIFPGIKDSYYYTLTNLSTTLKYNNGKKEITKKGKAWFDHQYFKVNDLKETIKDVRYDWFSIQIDNNTKTTKDDYQVIVMESFLRNKNSGNIKKYIAVIDNNGAKKEADDVIVKKSENGAVWLIVSKKLGIHFKVVSNLEDNRSSITIPDRFKDVVGTSVMRFYEANTIIKNQKGKQIGIGFIESTNF